MRYSGCKFLASGIVTGLLLFSAGCGGDKTQESAQQPKRIDGFKNFVSPKEIPLWLVVRQLNGVEKDFDLTVDEAVDQVIEAVRATGGTIRYGTKTGKARTIYALTAEGEGITIDVDPYRGQERKVEVDICVGMYGDKKKAEKIYHAFAGIPSSQCTTCTSAQ